MQRHLLIIFLQTSTYLWGEGLDLADKNPMSLLPLGSVMKDVLVPRYDQDQNLLGDLHSKTVTLVDAEQILGEQIKIRFFGDNQSTKGVINLRSAMFQPKHSRLVTHEPVFLESEQLVIHAQGLTYDFVHGKGLFMDEVTSRIIASAKNTSMKSKSLLSTALVAGLATSSVSAAPPAAPSSSEVMEISKIAEEKKTIPKVNLEEELRDSQKASESAQAMLAASGAKTAKSSADESSAQALEMTLTEADTLISCDGGMYFDAVEGVLVYMDNVRVKDPRFTLEGANQLKIFFAKKPEKKSDTTKTVSKKQSAPLGALGNFGDLKKFVAEGAVVIQQKGVKGKEPVQASGRILTYDLSKEEILIHGGYPWVKQGSYFARAKEADLTLRLLKDGSFSTRGNWEMGGKVEQN